MARDVAKMRAYWEERARLNPAYYVDTSLDYDNPDMARFLETGRRVVAICLDEPPAVQPSGQGTAVEIGCGMGRICLALSERFEHVIGYDISSEMLARGRGLMTADNVEFRLTEGASLPSLPDSSVDLVMSFTVFQHIPAVEVIRAYVDEAGRVLAPGGVFAVQWNGTPGALRWRARRVMKALQQRLGRGDRYGRDAPQFLGSRVPVDQMRAMMRNAGLELVATSGDGTLFTFGWARKPAT